MSLSDVLRQFTSPLLFASDKFVVRQDRDHTCERLGPNGWVLVPNVETFQVTATRGCPRHPVLFPILNILSLALFLGFLISIPYAFLDFWSDESILASAGLFASIIFLEVFLRKGLGTRKEWCVSLRLIGEQRFLTSALQQSRTTWDIWITAIMRLVWFVTTFLWAWVRNGWSLNFGEPAGKLRVYTTSDFNQARALRLWLTTATFSRIPPRPAHLTEAQWSEIYQQGAAIARDTLNS